MRTFFTLLPAGLSLLALAAHFLRRMQLTATLVCLVLFVMLFMRPRWARRTIQVALLGGALLWGMTVAALVPERRAAGEPWLRMAIILGAVAVVCVAAALLLELPRARRHFGPRAASGPGS